MTGSLPLKPSRIKAAPEVEALTEPRLHLMIIELVGAIHLQHFNLTGCIVCGKSTLPKRDTQGDGLRKLSVLLASGRYANSDGSPLCSKHWLDYIKFRKSIATMKL
jgi:hypothetical protein